MENTSPSERAGAQRYRVVAVEPDERFRTRMTLELAGIVPSPASSFDAVMRDIVPGEPIVVVFGPSLAGPEGFDGSQRLARTFPEAGVVLLAEELTLSILQDALRAGVRDALTIDAGERAIRQSVERVGETMAGAAHRAATAGLEPARLGKVFVSFATKGGVGKSVVATNLSVLLATKFPNRVVLIDADLQFGDDAVLLGIPPEHTSAEAASAVGNMDTTLMDSFLTIHEASTLRVLCAPVEPAAGERITAEEMIGMVRMLRTMYDYVIVDMPPHFDDVVLALLEEADEVLLIASLDIPSIKNLKVGIQTLDLLSVAGSKLRLVMNRANARVHLDISDVERALGVSAEFRIPSDIAIPQAVNRGVPVVLDKPRAPAALALRALADRYSTGDLSSHPTPAPEVPTEPRKRGWRR
jgi:pilus assembly protein CpaE